VKELGRKELTQLQRLFVSREAVLVGNFSRNKRVRRCGYDIVRREQAWSVLRAREVEWWVQFTCCKLIRHSALCRRTVVKYQQEELDTWLAHPLTGDDHDRGNAICCAIVFQDEGRRWHTTSCESDRANTAKNAILSTSAGSSA
jgi:hypothetical protein